MSKSTDWGKAAFILSLFLLGAVFFGLIYLKAQVPRKGVIEVRPKSRIIPDVDVKFDFEDRKPRREGE